jgi:uncharacterized protein YggE
MAGAGGPSTSSVTTTGTGAAAGVPDAARLTLVVQTSAPTVTDALARTAAGVGAAVEVATRFTDRDQVASRGFWVHPDHTPQGRRDGYAAGHRLVLDCPSLDAAAALVDALGAAVGDDLAVDAVAPVVSDPAALRVEARAAAFADARATAEQLAGLAGRALGEVVSVVEGGDTPGLPTGLAVRTASGSTAFEAGTESVAATLTVTWSLG